METIISNLVSSLMPSFGKASRAKLDQVDPRLVEICEQVISTRDFTIVSGFRSKDEQNAIFERGASKKQWPNSKHNKNAAGGISAPGCAIDVAPYFSEAPHIRWEDENEFIYLAGMFHQAASALGYTLRWGGNWDQDDDIIDDQTFQDIGHFEII